jgi:hypothetical protein
LIQYPLTLWHDQDADARTRAFGSFHLYHAARSQPVYVAPHSFLIAANAIGHFQENDTNLIALAKKEIPQNSE